MRDLFIVIVLVAAFLGGAFMAFAIYDTYQPPKVYREDTAHYLTQEGELIYADN